MINYKDFNCGSCGKYVSINFPQTHNEGNSFCWDCSYMKGLIDEEKFLSVCGIHLENTHASIRDGKVVIWVGKKAPWDRGGVEERSSKRYTDWRDSVYKRDSYTCQRCKLTGGKLNAHHIQHFATHIAERYEIGNGITLCESCHKNVHREERKIKNG